MKQFPFLFGIFALISVCAPGQVATDQDFIETEAARQIREKSAIFTEPKPNEITAGKVSYDGIGVQVVVVDNPLQLINPAAPELYGSPEDNLVKDPITGRPSGLKLFSINF